MQSTPAEQEEKKTDEVVESTPHTNPESSTLQSTTNPEGSNPDEDSTRNPDGDSTANPDGTGNHNGDSTANPDGTVNPDGNSSANPDGHEDADPDPEEQGATNTHISKEYEEQNQLDNKAAEEEDSEGVNPGQADEEEKASWLKVYVYQNETISRERVRTDVNEALRRYIYNIKKFKERWRMPLPTDKHADRRGTHLQDP